MNSLDLIYTWIINCKHKAILTRPAEIRKPVSNSAGLGSEKTSFYATLRLYFAFCTAALQNVALKKILL